MNLNKIKEGMIIKNYKELCSILDEPTKTGGAKKNQITWFENYFKYHKDGNKFIIDKVHKNKKIIQQNKKGGSHNPIEYTNNIERLLLDLLVQTDNQGKIFLSRNKIYKALEMINDNYAYCKQRIPKLSKYMDIDESNVREWYDTTGGMLERSLEKTLKKLENESLIYWSREITICKVKDTSNRNKNNEIKMMENIEYDEDGEEIVTHAPDFSTDYEHREATEKEVKFILKTEREIMKELLKGYNCEKVNKQQLIKNNLWGDFYKQVKKILLDKYNIAFHYKSYKILCNEEHIYEKWNSYYDLMLEHDVKNREQILLNKSIIQRIHDNAVKRQKKAIKDIDSEESVFYSESKTSKLEQRVKNSYIDNYDNLSNSLIYKDADSIKNKVKKQKL